MNNGDRKKAIGTMARTGLKVLPLAALALLASVDSTLAAPSAATDDWNSVADLAGDNVSDIAANMVESIRTVPGLISAFVYLLGILVAISAILKTKDHVETGRTELQSALVRYFVAGGLLALPMIADAMTGTIGTGGLDIIDGAFSVVGEVGGFLSGALDWGIGSGTLNSIMNNIRNSVSYLPGLLSAVAYILALILAASGVLKIREHVDNPGNVGLREPVGRFVIGGALFALPAVYNAMNRLVVGDGPSGTATFMTNVSQILGLGNAIASCGIDDLAAGATGDLGSIVGGFLGMENSLGDTMCQFGAGFSMAPLFLNATAYLFGLFLGIWGLMKIKEHILDPGRTSIWEGVSRMVAGGAFFSLPAVVQVMATTIGGTDIIVDSLTSAVSLGQAAFSWLQGSISYFKSGCAWSDLQDAGGAAIDSLTGLIGWTTSVSNPDGSPAACSGGTGGGGLDVMMSRFVSDIAGPMDFIVNFFCYVAGTVLIMIGISRLMKISQEGPNGPGGIGTIMTFLTGGALISLGPMVHAFSRSLGDLTDDDPVLSYTGGLSTDEQAHVTNVIKSATMFVSMLGTISFVRGLFIVRGVAEGNGQASMMAGLTHLIGGAMAVNIGPVINAVQSTLGLSDYGVAFN